MESEIEYESEENLSDRPLEDNVCAGAADVNDDDDDDDDDNDE